MKNVLACFVILIILPNLAFAIDTTAFVSPDNSYEVLENFISSTSDSLLISSYTFTSRDIGELLVEQENLGKDITLMLEAGPAGGIPDRELLCELKDNGIKVVNYDGDKRFLHAKYAIRDNSSVLISTENFGYTGFSKDKKGNRGWGAVIDNTDVAAPFLKLYLNDFSETYAISCKTSKVKNQTKKSTYIPKFSTESYSIKKVEILLSPDNSEEKILNLIDSANSSVYIAQFYIYKTWGPALNPLLEKAIEKAREGKEVKFLLDSSWYNIKENDRKSNYNTVQYVNGIAAQEGLNMEAKLVDLESTGLEKLHTKGIIVDKKLVLISSVNWNENSVRENREIGVILEGDVAGYFENVFWSDWGNTDLSGMFILDSNVTQIVLVTAVAFAGALLGYWMGRREV